MESEAILSIIESSSPEHLRDILQIKILFSRVSIWMILMRSVFRDLTDTK